MLIKILFIIGIILGVYLEQKFNLPKIQKLIDSIKNKIIPDDSQNNQTNKDTNNDKSSQAESRQKSIDEKYLTIAYVNENALKNTNKNSVNKEIIRIKNIENGQNLFILKEPKNESVKWRKIENYDKGIIIGKKINNTNYYQVIYNKNTTKLVNYNKDLQIVKNS